MQKFMRTPMTESTTICQKVSQSASAGKGLGQCCQLVYFQCAWYINFWFGVYEKFGIFLVYFGRRVDLCFQTKLFVILQNLNRENIVVLKVWNYYRATSVILFNMGASVHFWWTVNETERELRSSEKLKLALGMCFQSANGIQNLVNCLWACQKI